MCSHIPGFFLYILLYYLTKMAQSRLSTKEFKTQYIVHKAILSNCKLSHMFVLPIYSFETLLFTGSLTNGRRSLSEDEENEDDYEDEDFKEEEEEAHDILSSIMYIHEEADLSPVRHLDQNHMYLLQCLFRQRLPFKWMGIIS